MEGQLAALELPINEIFQSSLSTCTVLIESTPAPAPRNPGTHRNIDIGQITRSAYSIS